ncbi:MAG: serine/threonine-protein kinase [Chloroflexi bacterium OHK40]
MTSLIGRRLGRYELQAELGRGGMARVYRAVDPVLQRQVAIKVLAAQLSLDPEFVRRFEREATTAANLEHPAIVRIYDVGEQDGLYYIAMEYVHGRSLHAVLEEQATLGLGYAVSLLEPVAAALDYAHAQGAVHRDIKPHNILIDRDGRVLLTDFGIAQTPDSDGERLTRTGIFMGTPEYISPEQAEARRVDGRSDLYALGVVAYEVITGRVPFSGPTPQLIVAHAQLPPPPPTSVLAHLPAEIDEVLTKALAKRPERRYASGQALVAALRDVAQRYGIPLATREQLAALAEGAGHPPAPPIPRPVPPAPRRPRPGLPVPDDEIGGQPTAPARGPAAVSSGPRQPTASQRPATGSAGRPQVAARSQAAASRRYTVGPRQADSWVLLLIGLLLVLVTAAFIFLVARGLASSPGVPTAAPLPPTPSLVVPSLPPASPTAGLAATMVPATAEPGTAIPPPSATPAPPEATSAPQPPPPTLVPPPTQPPAPPVQPTEAPLVTVTPEPTPLPTETATPEPTPSPTETATITPTPEPSPTEAPPILDNTPILVTPITPPSGP